MDGLIVHINTHRSKCQSIVILAYFLLELSAILRVIKEVLKNTWPLLNREKIDLALKTACSKARITNWRVGELLTNKV